MKIFLARIANSRNNLWQWFVHHAESKHALPWLALIAFLDNLFLPVAVELFLVALMLAHPKRWKAYLPVAILSSTAGAIVSYFVARFLFVYVGHVLLHTYGLQQAFVQARHLFNDHVFATMFIVSFTPVPDKAFIYAAGFLHVNFWFFILGHLLGRGLRMTLLVYFTGRFGKHILDIIDRYLLWTFVGVLTILGVYGIVHWHLLPF